MGNLHRLQVSQILYPGADLPVQSTAVRSVDSPHGDYYHSKGGKTDGHPQRYKNPPVPR